MCTAAIKTIPVIGKERRSKNAAPTMTAMHRSIINGTMAFDHKIQRGEIVYGISATDYLQKVAQFLLAHGKCLHPTATATASPLKLPLATDPLMEKSKHAFDQDVTTPEH